MLCVRKETVSLIKNSFYDLSMCKREDTIWITSTHLKTIKNRVKFKGSSNPTNIVSSLPKAAATYYLNAGIQNKKCLNN